MTGMPMTDTNDLIQQLAGLARRKHYTCEDSWYNCPQSPDGSANDNAGTECDCGADEHNAKVDAICAALSQPELEAPTDVELQELLYYKFTTSTGHGERSDPIGFARWGRLSIKPVPLRERLPGLKDCDEEGRCWYFFMDSVIGGCGWQMFNEEENEQLETSYFWLPHYALPVPTLCDEENK